MKILMIDDMPSRAKLLWRAHLLHKDITVAHGFDQIKFYLENFKYDLILLDHDMPLLSGPEVVTQFLQERSIPIIIISSNISGSEKMKVLLEEYEVPVCIKNITDPRSIVDMIKMKELHGMAYSG